MQSSAADKLFTTQPIAFYGVEAITLALSQLQIRQTYGMPLDLKFQAREKSQPKLSSVFYLPKYFKVNLDGYLAMPKRSVAATDVLKNGLGYYQEELVPKTSAYHASELQTGLDQATTALNIVRQSFQSAADESLPSQQRVRIAKRLYPHITVEEFADMSRDYNLSSDTGLLSSTNKARFAEEIYTSKNALVLNISNLPQREFNHEILNNVDSRIKLAHQTGPLTRMPFMTQVERAKLVASQFKVRNGSVIPNPRFGTNFTTPI